MADQKPYVSPSDLQENSIPCLCVYCSVTAEVAQALSTCACDDEQQTV